MSKLRTIAQATIGKPPGNMKLRKPNGSTADIVNQILASDRKYRNQLAAFAPHLRGRNLLETCRNIWNFVKTNIRYQVDPSGVQYVKSPSRAFHDGVADCKSYSLFIGSCLHSLGIPFLYRFVSYGSDPIWTHIYVVVPAMGQEIIMDDVMDAFNTEKKFSFKKDFDMSKVYEVNGIGKSAGKKLVVSPADKLELGDPKDLTDGKIMLRIAQQRLAIKKRLAEGVRGVGSQLAERYQDQLDVVNDALENTHDEDEMGYIAEQAGRGMYSLAPEVAGIGSIGKRNEKRKEKKQERKKEREQKKAEGKKPDAKGGLKTFLDKAAKATGKALKAVAKVASAPARAAVKVLLEVTLPKAAPFFLYLFINDPAVIAKLPEKVRKKRKSAEGIADFIVNTIGMKRSHFMGIVRNGILKQTGKDPEKLIAESLKGKVSGIGVLPALAIGPLIELIQKIASLFKKKGPDVNKDEAADLNSDFEGMDSSLSASLANDISNQAPDDITDPNDPNSAGGRKAGGIC